MTTITMARSQYLSLLAAAGGDATVNVAELKSAINLANGITEYVLYVRWYEAGGQTPKAFDIGQGTGWPKEQQVQLILERPITREDVDTVLGTSGINPVDPMVTRDDLGLVGWTILNDYDFQVNV